MMKLANIGEENFISSEPLEEYQLNLCPTIILKVTKNQGFTPSLENTALEKPQGGGGKLTPCQPFYG